MVLSLSALATRDGRGGPGVRSTKDGFRSSSQDFFDELSQGNQVVKPIEPFGVRLVDGKCAQRQLYRDGPLDGYTLM